MDEGFDLAVRIGPSETTVGLSSCAIGKHATLLCAAPSLIERLGMPSSLDDLDRYDALVYHRDNWSERWTFPDDGGRMTLIEPTSRIRAADLGVIMDAAISGRGIAWLPDWLIEDELESGRLLQLLPDLPVRQRDINLFWVTTPTIPGRLQLAIDALTLTVPMA